jgi:acrylyl-CoA reductase (NADPH)
MRALLIDKGTSGTSGTVTSVDDAKLPDRAVTVRVSHSTLNYKDGLAILGKGPVVRNFPMVAGIDLVGTVETSSDPRWSAGDAVLVNGFGLGELHWGGLAEKARVDGDWLTALPAGLSPARAAAIGTAGYTAMLCVMGLERVGMTPARGEAIVTGASGGVGGIAIQLLANLGYKVVASTGRMEEAAYLEQLGAAEVIDRKALSEPNPRPLQKARYAAAIDSVGSHTLANVCAQMLDDGVVTACGLAQGADLPATVIPFILRGVVLVGIHSVYRSAADRATAWRRLATELDLAKLDLMTRTVALDDAVAAAGDLLAGKVRGRIVVAI